MQIEINSLPQIQFAHIYRAERYSCVFPQTENTMEITYIAEGELSCEINGKGYTARKGDVICLLHTGETRVWAEKPHCHHTVGVKVEWSAAAAALLIPVVLSTGEERAEIAGGIDGIIRHLEEYKACIAKGSAAVLNILCAVDRCGRREDNAALSGEAVYAARAKRYVQQHVHEPITQRKIAAHLGITPGYLCSVFRSAEGMTLMRYVNRTKLSRMKALMENERIRLSEAAAIYGYADANYVSRLYKALFGKNITERE